jgi:transcriptional regulator with XRE-family HTH domain
MKKKKGTVKKAKGTSSKRHLPFAATGGTIPLYFYSKYGYHLHMKKSGNIPKLSDELIRENLRAVGSQLKEIRKILRLNQKEMAEKLHVSNTYVSDIETGKVNPSHTFFFKLSFVSNVSLDYLYHGLGEMFLKTEVARDPVKDRSENDIKSIDDLVWFMENSPLVYHQVIAFAASFRYDKEESIMKDLAKNRKDRDG